MATPSSDPRLTGTAHARAPVARRYPGGAEPPVRTQKRGARLPVAASVAALWAAAVSYGPILALAAVGTIGSTITPMGAARLAAAGWLLAHGVPLETPADRISLVPLALSALVAWRLVRAGVHASRAIGGHRAASVGRAVAAGASVAVVYAGLGAGVAALTGTGDLMVAPERAAITTGVFAAVAAIGGAIGGSRAGRSLAGRMPVALDAARTGAAAALVIVAAGAAAAGIATAIRGGDAAEMLATYRAGVLGQAGITALCLAYLPNVAIWGAAYLLGPGFAVGADTAVSPTDVLLGPVPGLPVLAGLPSGELAGIGPVLLGVPLLAGVCAGWFVAARSRGSDARFRRLVGQSRGPDGSSGWAGATGSALLAGPVAGLVMQSAAFASTGALGSGRLSEMGSADWRIGALATVVVSLGALVGVAAGRVLSRRGPA